MSGRCGCNLEALLFVCLISKPNCVQYTFPLNHTAYVTDHITEIRKPFRVGCACLHIYVHQKLGLGFQSATFQATVLKP